MNKHNIQFYLLGGLLYATVYSIIGNPLFIDIAAVFVGIGVGVWLERDN